MGLCKKKRNKRCIPKEGMPHTSACQKKERIKMHAQRRYATCLGMSKKREENKRSIPKEGMPHASACQKKKRRDSPYPKRKKERWFILRSSYTIHQKYPHTYTS